jgi:hypothetical protein
VKNNVAVRLACFATANQKILQIFVVKRPHLLKFLNAVAGTETGEYCKLKEM